MTNESERAAFEKQISRLKTLSNVYLRDGTGATDALYNLAVKHGASEQEAAGFAHHANHGLNDLQSLIYDMAAIAQQRAQLIAEQEKAEAVVTDDDVMLARRIVFGQDEVVEWVTMRQVLEDFTRRKSVYPVPSTDRVAAQDGSCPHPSWDDAESGKKRCALCGAIGDERRYLDVSGDSELVEDNGWREWVSKLRKAIGNQKDWMLITANVRANESGCEFEEVRLSITNDQQSTDRVAAQGGDEVTRALLEAAASAYVEDDPIHAEVNWNRLERAIIAALRATPADGDKIAKAIGDGV